MRPRIGIALASPWLGEPGADATRERLSQEYPRAISEAGGSALGLLLQPEPAALLEAVDALVVPGGDDFVPAEAGARASGLRPVRPERLAFDRALVEAAWARGLPILGICYGMQLLALCRGGRLVHDLALEPPGAAEHRLAGEDLRHEIRVAPDSRLARALGETRIGVNSRHHQAVATAGRGLRAVAHAPDGVVEAIEAEGERFALGVQWHPEGMEPAHRRAVFGALVAAARARRG